MFRGRHHALYLLSTLVTASRCRRTNEAALLGGHGHFFVVAYYWFEGGFTRGLATLGRQRRTPTKDRIRNTPVNWASQDDWPCVQSKNRSDNMHPGMPRCKRDITVTPPMLARGRQNEIRQALQAGADWDHGVNDHHDVVAMGCVVEEFRLSG